MKAINKVILIATVIFGLFLTASCEMPVKEEKRIVGEWEGAKIDERREFKVYMDIEYLGDNKYKVYRKKETIYLKSKKDPIESDMETVLYFFPETNSLGMEGNQLVYVFDKGFKELQIKSLKITLDKLD